MLRYAFLPSDFHPQFLILGESSDIASLIRCLRDFATAMETTQVGHQPPADGSKDVRLTLVPSEATQGMHVSDTRPTEFEWRLNAEGAEVFATLIEEALNTPDPAGSVMLEVRAPGEIPVKISYGEFTEQFLIEDF